MALENLFKDMTGISLSNKKLMAQVPTSTGFDKAIFQGLGYLTVTRPIADFMRKVMPK